LACSTPWPTPPHLRVRLSLRLDPVRRFADAACRRPGSSRRRLGQYRRHQCFAHRPQGTRRGDAGRRHAQGHGGRALAGYVLGRDAAIVAAVGAFLGHLFPVWLNFRGGKGVATYIGLLLGLAWTAAVFFCVVWLAVAALSRYSSLAALIASAQRHSFCGGTAASPRRLGIFAAVGAVVDHASRQYRPAVARQGRQNRRRLGRCGRLLRRSRTAAVAKTRLVSTHALETVAIVSRVTKMITARCAGVAFAGFGGHEALGTVWKTLVLDCGGRFLSQQTCKDAGKNDDGFSHGFSPG
jgi:hypothetical protein